MSGAMLIVCGLQEKVRVDSELLANIVRAIEHCRPAAHLAHIPQFDSANHQALRASINNSLTPVIWDSPVLHSGLSGLFLSQYTRSGYGQIPDFLLKQAQRAGRVLLAGRDTDTNLLATAFSLWDQGVMPVLLQDCAFSLHHPRAHVEALGYFRKSFGPASLSTLSKELPLIAQ